MELLKSLVEVTCSPLGIMVLALAGGAVLSFMHRQSRTGRRLLLLGTLLFFIYFFSPLAEILIARLEQQSPPMLTPPDAPRIERIVVLAGYGEAHPAFPVTSNISEQTICSLTEGLRLYRLLPGSRMIMSGGTVHRGDKPIAYLMADFLRQMGVPAQDLFIEGNSHTTYENLLEVRKLVGEVPFILVAAACDVRRANDVARKLRMHSYPAPACFWALPNYCGNSITVGTALCYLKGFAYPSTARLSRLQWAYHEYLGYLWYRILGRI